MPIFTRTPTVSAIDPPPINSKQTRAPYESIKTFPYGENPFETIAFYKKAWYNGYV